MSGSNFSTIHGDLVTEVFNGETKRQPGPHRLGYSTNSDAVNERVTTAHVHAKLKEKLNEKIKLSTSCVHKETTPGAKKVNDSHIQLLYTKLAHYGTDPFDGNARDITTGKEIDKAIFNDVSKAADNGNIKFQEFLQKWLVKGEVDFFSLVKKKNLQT